VVQTIGSEVRKELFTGSPARYPPTGHLVYGLENTLAAIRFDPDTLEPIGSSVTLIQDVYRSNTGYTTQSDESGRNEVYIRPFPDVDSGRRQVSTNGGDYPLWSPNGRELFYQCGDSFMAVEVETELALKLGKTAVLFKGTYSSGSGLINFLATPWDIHPDGKRFQREICIAAHKFTCFEKENPYEEAFRNCSAGICSVFDLCFYRTASKGRCNSITGIPVP
jgi:hypothetical protein